MGTCNDPQVNCDTCFEVLIGDCLDDITLSLGLTPSTLFFFRLIDKFGAQNDFTATTNGSGDFTIPKSQLPTNLINQFAGNFQLEIYSDSNRTELVDFLQNSNAYNCVILTQELSGQNNITPPSVFSNDFSFLFDGVDEFFNIDSVQTSLAPTTKGSWSIWAKPIDSTPLAAEYFIAFGDTNASEELRIRMETDGKINGIFDIAGVRQWQFATTASPLTSGVWSHIVLVQDAIEPVLYIAGLVEPITFSTSLAKPAWFSAAAGLDNGRIGATNRAGAGNTGHFNGNIDEVLFVNRALTSAQIISIFNSGTPKDESSIFNGVSNFRMGDKALWDGLNWTMLDQIGSNDSLSSNMEFEDKVSDTPP